MGQREGVANVIGRCIQRDALQFTRSTFALGDIRGLDHRETQAPKVTGDITDIDFGQCALEGQYKIRLTLGTA